MSQEVRCIPLLPFAADSKGTDETAAAGGAEVAGQVAFDSPAADIFAETIPLVIHSSLQQCILESKASEHASRMTAMDSATNNANDLIDKLRLFYNRARQSAITTELIDIVGGAEAAQS
ncbi:MAG: F0F1 ATP synthase subunit gamma, partial [bacterium]|nr:F0F1 ATP synthase subunit gamma [bacterium]